MNRVKKKTYVSISLENAESWNDKLIHGEDNKQYLNSFTIHNIHFNFAVLSYM